MRIVVCVKQVPDTSVPVDFNLERGVVNEESIVYVVNPYDECAVELALRIREVAGGDVTAVCVGPAESEKALRRCLAMGVDRAVHISDEAFIGSDAYAISLVLAKAVERLGYDLILCGAQAADDNSAQVGAIIAELLGLPQITNVTELRVLPATDTVQAVRWLERGDRLVVECAPPAVLTIDKGISDIRYPTLSRRLEAMEAVVVKYDGHDLGLSRDDVGLNGSLVATLDYSIPRPKTKRVTIADSSLSVEERLRLLLSGGVAEKEGGDLVEGRAEQAADAVIQYLVRKRLLMTRGSVDR